MIYVTHDQVEAMTLADRIVVLKTKVGSSRSARPAELYERPATEFVANLLSAALHEPRSGRRRRGRRAPRPLASAPNTSAPTPPAPGPGPWPMSNICGVDTIGYVDVAEIGRLALRLPGRAPMVPGETLTLGYDPATLHRFRSGRRIDEAAD